MSPASDYPWLADLFALYGQPSVNESRPVAWVGAQRQAWAWFPDGQYTSIVVDRRSNGTTNLRVWQRGPDGGPGRSANLTVVGDLTDVEARRLLGLAGILPLPRVGDA